MFIKEILFSLRDELKSEKQSTP